MANVSQLVGLLCHPTNNQHWISRPLTVEALGQADPRGRPPHSKPIAHGPHPPSHTFIFPAVVNTTDSATYCTSRPYGLSVMAVCQRCHTKSCGPSSKCHRACRLWNKTMVCFGCWRDLSGMWFRTGWFRWSVGVPPESQRGCRNVRSLRTPTLSISRSW